VAAALPSLVAELSQAADPFAGSVERRRCARARDGSHHPAAAAGELPGRSGRAQHGTVVPEPFRPQLVHGFGVAGICLIRLRGLRPASGRGRVGLASENAAHRIAVEWDTAQGVRSGVYIPRRDTASLLTAMVGGRLFPGAHHLARFRVDEDDGHYRIALAARDGIHVQVEAHLAADLQAGSVFDSLEQASRFFTRGSIGWSVTRQTGVYDGLELDAPGSRLEPARLVSVASSFFDDPRRFPPGTVAPDSAFVMREVPSRWHAREAMAARWPRGLCISVHSV